MEYMIKIRCWLWQEIKFASVKCDRWVKRTHLWVDPAYNLQSELTAWLWPACFTFNVAALRCRKKTINHGVTAAIAHRSPLPSVICHVTNETRHSYTSVTRVHATSSFICVPPHGTVTSTLGTVAQWEIRPNMCADFPSNRALIYPSSSTFSSPDGRTIDSEARETPIAICSILARQIDFESTPFLCSNAAWSELRSFRFRVELC